MVLDGFISCVYLYFQSAWPVDPRRYYITYCEVATHGTHRRQACPRERKARQGKRVLKDVVRSVTWLFVMCLLVERRTTTERSFPYNLTSSGILRHCVQNRTGTVLLGSVIQTETYEDSSGLGRPRRPTYVWWLPALISSISRTRIHVKQRNRKHTHWLIKWITIYR